jgi:hypothetical protein
MQSCSPGSRRRRRRLPPMELSLDAGARHTNQNGGLELGKGGVVESILF